MANRLLITRLVRELAPLLQSMAKIQHDCLLALEGASPPVNSRAWSETRQKARKVVRQLEDAGYNVPAWITEMLEQSPHHYSMLVRSRFATLDDCRRSLEERDRLLQPKPAKRSHMSVDEASTAAMRLASKDGVGFLQMSDSAQAKRIGCHLKTWRRTQFYKTVLKRRAGMSQRAGKPPQSGARPAVSLTSKLEASVHDGERDEMLKKLVAEQEADHEPSPLDKDAPASRTRKVYSRKRL
jgi:hypothetical protein